VVTVSVPLIFPMKCVVRRLDIQATWAVDPPGAEHDTGYDYLLEEPVISRSSGARAHPRVEMTAVEIPCQIETARFEELQATFGGNDPVTNQVFVFHRAQLRALSLIDSTTGDCLLKPGDRIESLKKGTRTVRTYQKPLYVFELRMGSQGFGEDGYDLELCYTSYHSSGPQR
jgi:hypothetical protein